MLKFEQWLGGTVELTRERALLLELMNLWRYENDTHFRGLMHPPALGLSDRAGELGRWCADTRLISISRALAFEQPWVAVEEVLRHEMAHQFVDEVLHARDETAHGPAFRSVCERIGIDPAASGLPRSAELDPQATRMIDKISKLLNLAASPNQHEAEAATLAARRLMLQHNIDASPRAKRYAFKRLGKPKGRTEESERMVGGILADHFFVEIIWVSEYLPNEMKRGTVLEVMGTPENLAIAEYVHAFLLHSAGALWRAHQVSRGIRSNRDRRTFQAGVMSGFRKKLAQEQRVEATQALVWVADGDLRRYYRRRYPRTTTTRSSGNRRNEAFDQGREAGQNLVLSKAVQSETTSRGRLLGSGR